MIIQVIVKPGSKNEAVTRLPDGSLKVLVRERAIEGRANEAVREAIATYLKVSRSKIVLLRGLKSKIKQFEVLSGLCTRKKILNKR